MNKVGLNGWLTLNGGSGNFIAYNDSVTLGGSKGITVNNFTGKRFYS